jgi:hypothetical protein
MLLAFKTFATTETIITLLTLLLITFNQPLTLVRAIKGILNIGYLIVDKVPHPPKPN